MKKYNPQKIERKWQRFWEAKNIYEPNLNNPSGRGKFYNLMMFPYPSAEGLHVGNMYAFVGSDIYGRYQRMKGYDVFEPIGLDGFGIHSENFALKTGKHPIDHAKVSEKNFYRQLQMIGNSFAWEEKLETYDPGYYKWTQWIFIQMFKKGLAYRKKATVNWCSSCLTVLADEQVLSGECERCATEVVKKELEQWFFKITDYAEKLLSNIPKIDWSERVKTAQTNWIGKSEGVIVKFKLDDSRTDTDSTRTDADRQKLSVSGQHKSAYIEVFTTRPDTLFGATYLVLSPEHELLEKLKENIKNWGEVSTYIESAGQKSEVDRIAEGREKSGICLEGINALNPATKEKIPIWIADYVLGGYGTGAIMAVPAHDERDFEFAKKFNLPIRKVIKPRPVAVAVRSIEDIAAGSGSGLRIETDLWDGEGEMVNSGKFDGMDSEKAKEEITKEVGGERKIQYHLRDWLISRQRYWGPPIPMIYCEKCDWQPVPEDELPVLLPKVKNFRPTGTDQSPLASVEKFYKTKCPVCKREARRETDVSDTFLDSAWYYLRYPSVKDNKHPWDDEVTKRWLPVDMYIGGAEHSVLHLLYARFLAMVFNDLGFIDFEEPFSKFRAHGLLIKDGAKMSKSRGNVVNPDEYIKRYGADALRMYLMFLGPFEQGGDFRDTGMSGITRFLNRVWNFNLRNAERMENTERENKEADRIINKYVKEIGDDIKNLKFNTGVSGLMKLLNELEDQWLTKNQYATFLKLLAPFAPHIAEELWQMLQKSQHKSASSPHRSASVHLESWPDYNETLLAEEMVRLVIQVNGKVRDIIEVKKGLSESGAKRVAIESEKVKKHVPGEPKKIIYIQDRLINIVI